MCHRQGAVHGALRPASQGHPTLTARNGPPPIRGVATVLPTGRRRVRPTIPPVRSPKTRLDSAGARRRRSVGWSCRNPAPRFALTARGGMMGRTLRDRPDQPCDHRAGGRGPRTMEEVGMARSVLSSSRIAVAGTVAVTLSLVAALAGQAPAGAIAMDGDDIAGVVAGPNGPEAGVWVIAETRDLPTRHAKIVVTDDAGRYLLHDLPQATYDVWVRGYGLVDSEKVQAQPGAALDLTAVAAPDAAAAAEYNPAQDWFALLEVPGPDEFPGHGVGRERHLAGHREPGRVDPLGGQHGRLHRMPRAGEQGHAGNSRCARRLRLASRRVGPPGAVRAGGRRHGRAAGRGRARPRAGDVRRLDRPHTRPASTR